MPRTIHLMPDLDGFVDRLIASGRYADASEVICDALSLLEDREAALRARRAKVGARIAEGLADLEAGRPAPADEVFGRLKKKLEEREKRRNAAE